MTNTLTTNKTKELIDHVNESVIRAENQTSKISKISNSECEISGSSHSVLGIEGMSQPKNRHLLNNLCSREETSYLEIGTWKGASTISALYNNKHIRNSLSIENWSDFGGTVEKSIATVNIEKGQTIKKDMVTVKQRGPKEEFNQNISNFANHIPMKTHRMIEANCWFLDTTKIGKFNTYFYDGDHSGLYQYTAITRYWAALENEAIIIIDDWNGEDVTEQTKHGLRDMGATILHEVILPEEGWKLKTGDSKGWHEGVAIFVIRK